MRLSTFLWVIGLFISVGAFHYFTRPLPVVIPEDSPVKTMSQKVVVLEKDDTLEWLQLQNLEANTSVTLTQKNGDWSLKYPVEDDAEDELVQEMVLQLMETKSGEALFPEKDWEEYGLARPRFKIGMETTRGRRYLLLGDDSPVAERIFARWEDGKNYFLVSPDIETLFKPSVYTLRNKKVFHSGAEQISKITFRTASGSYEIEKKKTGWIWTRPKEFYEIPADPPLVQALTSALESLYVKEFVDNSKNFSGYGFSEEGTYFKLGFQDAGPQTLHLGIEFAERDSLYARREGDKSLLLLDRAKVRAVMEAADVLVQGQKTDLAA